MEIVGPTKEKMMGHAPTTMYKPAMLMKEGLLVAAEYAEQDGREVWSGVLGSVLDFFCYYNLRLFKVSKL